MCSETFLCVCVYLNVSYLEVESGNGKNDSGEESSISNEAIEAVDVRRWRGTSLLVHQGVERRAEFTLGSAPGG